MILISEIGNNHFGDLEKAKEMIRISKECGADLVKGQAFLAEDINGSMPFSFYKKCEFGVDQYLELIWYGKQIGIDVFYSVFSKSLLPMTFHQKWHKITGSQSKRNPGSTERHDKENFFVSVQELAVRPKLEYATVLYVSEYLINNPRLENIDNMREFYKRPVGYSDHTMGIDWCVKAVKHHCAHVIEKHFTLDRNIMWEGVQFRDSVHAADPKQLEDLAKQIK